jgi:transcriptional regulator with XRE-family HTH domain
MKKTSEYTGIQTDRLSQEVALPGEPTPLSLGAFLKDWRSRLDPVSCGFARGRRRTPGLRREEVAQLANVSVTWYTWLEQGREAHPSSDVLERIAGALRLGPVEREHLFLLAQRRPAPLREREWGVVRPQLQRLLDSLATSPAYIRTPCWDIVAWNAAATVVLSDYAAMPPEQRNILRILFGKSCVRAMMPDWQTDVAAAIAAFRADLARTTRPQRAIALIAELEQDSADFRRLWQQQDVRDFGPGVKRLLHPVLGPLDLDYAALSIDGEDGLGLVVYTPSEQDRERIAALLRNRP